jgi:hypothetical protein
MVINKETVVSDKENYFFILKTGKNQQRLFIEETVVDCCHQQRFLTEKPLLMTSKIIF